VSGLLGSLLAITRLAFSCVVVEGVKLTVIAAVAFGARDVEQAGEAVIEKSAALGPEMVMQLEAANIKFAVPTLFMVVVKEAVLP
jgi:hypothetical protein